MAALECSLTNGHVDVVVAMSEGLRISRYGFVGGVNLMAEASGRRTETPLGPWQPLGGHRLWVAPESMPGSYAPDALPIACEQHDQRSARFVQPADGAGIEKQIEIAMAASGSQVTVTHRVVNRTCWPVRIAPWAISIVSGLASVYVPQPPSKSHDADFLPARAVVHWFYTDLGDRRWSVGRRLIRLQPDPSRHTAQKLGFGNEAGWCAIQLDDVIFVKQFDWQTGRDYPDYGCNNELFTIEDYLEVETLAPLELIEPNHSAVHVERWTLFRAPQFTSDDERAQREMFESLMRSSASR